jgi:hypothetical protein
MDFFKKLSSFLTPTSRGEADAYWINARCNRCGEVVRSRVNLNNDLSPEYDGEVLSYVCRKVLIGGANKSGEQRCFQQIEVWLKFDAGRKLVEREIRGGSFADEAS